MMRRWIGLFGLLWAAATPCALATQLTVVDGEGRPLEGAVVWASDRPVAEGAVRQKPYILDQIDRAFVPHVLVVPQGARVAFPNSDPILHHVYSFSRAKTFEIKLYKSRSASPLVFGRSGVVEVGCNIHDWMLAYIVVVDSMRFAKTDEQGQAQIEVPADSRELSLWHPRFKAIDHFEVRRLEGPAGPQLRWAVTSALVAPVQRLEGERFDGY